MSNQFTKQNVEKYIQWDTTLLLTITGLTSFVYHLLTPTSVKSNEILRTFELIAVARLTVTWLTVAQLTTHRIKFTVYK